MDRYSDREKIVLDSEEMFELFTKGRVEDDDIVVEVDNIMQFYNMAIEVDDVGMLD